MKYKCDFIKDLLPLYADNVCSAETKAVVEEHFAECADCKIAYRKMKRDIRRESLTDYSASIAAIKKDNTKRVNKKALIFSIICLVLIVIIADFVIRAVIFYQVKDNADYKLESLGSLTTDQSGSTKGAALKYKDISFENSWALANDCEKNDCYAKYKSQSRNIDLEVYVNSTVLSMDEYLKSMVNDDGWLANHNFDDLTDYIKWNEYSRCNTPITMLWYVYNKSSENDTRNFLMSAKTFRMYIMLYTLRAELYDPELSAVSRVKTPDYDFLVRKYYDSSNEKTTYDIIFQSSDLQKQGKFVVTDYNSTLDNDDISVFLQTVI